MQTTPLRALLLLDRKLCCFDRLERQRWRRVALSGEDWYALTTSSGLSTALSELDAAPARGPRWSSLEVHLFYSAAAMQQLAEGLPKLVELGCSRWQVLRWEPWRARCERLSGLECAAPLPSEDWLAQQLLPLLESTLELDAPPPASTRPEPSVADDPAQLQRARIGLQEELEAMRALVAALQQPTLEQLISYLPAVYRNPFVSIAPHDLALLAGQLHVPQIASPWPEPSTDTLLTLQNRLRRLPQGEAERLRHFCRQLPHRLDVRAEMRAWLGEG